MMVVCKIEEERTNLVRLSLIGNDLSEVFFETCEQNYFCEKLPEMMRKIMDILKQKYHYAILNNTDCKTDFDLNKHITTYRIFKSFIQGLI